MEELFDVDNVIVKNAKLKLFDVDYKEPEYEVDFALQRCKSRVVEMQSKDYSLDPSYYEQLQSGIAAPNTNQSKETNVKID